MYASFIQISFVKYNVMYVLIDAYITILLKYDPLQ